MKGDAQPLIKLCYEAEYIKRMAERGVYITKASTQY